MCPFQNQDSWKNLWINHKNLFKKAREMEEQGKRYPEITLTWDRTLKDFENGFKTQTTLFTLGEGYNCNGWCMT
jgi:hypothetical protein